MDLLSFIKSNIVILDGAMGTVLQRYGLQPGEKPEKGGLPGPVPAQDADVFPLFNLEGKAVQKRLAHLDRTLMRHPADVNADGSVNVADLSAIHAYILY